MDAEQILGLFDSLWFEQRIFKNQSFSSASQNPDRENQEKSQKPSKSTADQSFPLVPSIRTRSMSEDLSSKLTFISFASHSPDSSIFSPKLQTIFSSKDIAGSTTEPSPGNTKEKPERKIASRRKNRGRRRDGYGSKSLSELEFEEVKGFMDLGFVFSEEDKDSGLASIIPGLNRLGKKVVHDVEDESSGDGAGAGADEGEVSRPYLSEAWEALEREKELEKMPLMKNWRFPALSNENGMKDNLRWWAHTVASTVR